jgi:nickel/cobalt exporter
LTIPDAQSLPLGWAYLPVAFALGALHALEPGHGKSLASAYLVGGKRDWKDAVTLGLATTISHTAVVLLLAAGGLALQHYVSTDVLQRWTRLAGAAILALMGAWVAVAAFRAIRHGHSHGHDHGRPANDGGFEQNGYWGVALLGLSNGALPCPGALAALLVALSLGQVALGLVTVLTYSLGLACALTAMCVVVVEAGRRVRALLPSDRAMMWLPLASGVLVLGTGVWLVWSR